MAIIHEELGAESKKINETIMLVQPSLPLQVTNNIYYTKLKYLMFNEIVKYCKEKNELKQDLLELRTDIGEFKSEEDITMIFNALKAKYNGIINDIGLEYHIESTRYDYGVCLFCMIKRGDTVYSKKFIFRYRKTAVSQGLDYSGLNIAGLTMPDAVKHDLLDLAKGADDV